MDEEKLKQEIVALLYQRAPYIIPFNVVIGTLVLLWLTFDKVPQYLVLYWWGALLAVSIVRFIYVLYVLKGKRWESRSIAMRNVFVIGAFITGCIWGASYLIFSPYLSQLHQVFLMLALAGMCSGGLAPMSSLVFCYLCFVIPTFAPTIIAHLTRWTVDNFTVAIMFSAYLTSLIIICMGNNKSIKSNILLTLNKERLLVSIKAANQELQAAYKKIEEAALTDKLTGIPNRRFLEFTMKKSWPIAQRAHFLVAIMIIDIDYFKEYNDKYGHLEGDNCLMQIAKVINESVRRRGDFCARYGGDEFIAVLFDTLSDAAKNIAIEIKNGIAALQMPNKLSQVSEYVTVSIGLASTVPDGVGDYYMLIDAADKALYQSKKHGKNQITTVNI